jgi:ATP-binding cassette subfamily C protein
MMFKDVITSAAFGNAVTLFGALVAVAIATASIEIARAFALIRVEGKSNALLQSAIVDRLLALPPQFFRKYSVGDLALRAEAINGARQAITGVALTSLFGGAMVVTSVALMCIYSVKLALVALGVLVVSAVATAAVGLYALPYERQRHALLGSISTLVFELLSGIAKLHVAAAERRMFALWGAKFRELKVVSFRAGLAAAVLAVFNTMLPILASGALFVVAAKIVGAGALSTGSFIAFIAAFGTALAAGIGVSTTLVSILNIVPLFERAAPILATAPEVDQAKPDVGQISGRIELSQVTFSYLAGAAPIIEDVSFEIRPGEFVAFVGPSGGGKSTILRLLLGFERPDRGAVYYDGHDLASIDVSSIRRQSAVVLQHSKLLVGDVFTNIVGASPLTHEDAWRAAELAGLADDINAMPMGMNTVISEGGSTLSGGQRQRLLIARALVRNPRVVFFDEATSALDNRSQDIVTRSLERMEATRIVIAHRLTTVQRADRIFVMAKGRIVQQGTYDDLLETDGLFRNLAERQLV